MDFPVYRAFDHHQHEAQVDGNVDLFCTDGNMPVDTGTAEIERISGPVVFHVEFFGDVLCNALHCFLGIFQGFAVIASNFDTGHECLSGSGLLGVVLF